MVHGDVFVAMNRFKVPPVICFIISDVWGHLNFLKLMRVVHRLSFARFGHPRWVEEKKFFFLMFHGAVFVAIAETNSTWGASKSSGKGNGVVRMF